ncbi:MAG: dihydrodipicolinate synthase family protein [Verrucomicrobia bacterium]|nr:dihydrodipicolinate synthase family protein [Verrucomicrobiota bacterium]
MNLPRGIVSVLQTPFTPGGNVDDASLVKLMEAAMRDGVNGFLAPVVASEVDFLSRQEREEIIRCVAATVRGRVPFIVGASSRDMDECRHFARLAEEVRAAAYLVAVPSALYSRPEEIVGFFQAVRASIDLPLVIQDLEWNGPGLSIRTLRRIKEVVPTLAGVKIETVPSGPKYTAVRRALGSEFFIAGGWAVPQMIEVLDRGVDALIPESSMVAVYSAIYRAHASGDRAKAVRIFHRLIPVLTFTNQEIGLSIAFFKRLLERKGVFLSATMRQTWSGWDEYNLRIADELIDLYLALEKEIQAERPHQAAEPPTKGGGHNASC